MERTGKREVITTIIKLLKRVSKRQFFLLGIAAIVLFGLACTQAWVFFSRKSAEAQFQGIEERILRDNSYIDNSGYSLFGQTNDSEGFGGEGELNGNILVQDIAFLSSHNPSLNLFIGSGIFDRQRSGIITYEVQTGDTLSYIAASFGISTDTLLWANNLNYWSVIKPGNKFVILPVSGILHEAKKGETLSDIVKKYKGDIAETIAYNGSPADGALQLGQKIIIPGGRTQVYSQPAQPKVQYAYSSAIGLYGDKSHKFPWGQCTWYVAQKRYIPWSGNAKQWLDNARRFGFQTGKEPQVGAIVATNETWYGHVAYVEAVDENYITISEMSLGRGKLHIRNIPINSRLIKGYIY